MFKKIKGLSLIGICLIVSGCGSYFNQPIKQQNARVGEITPQTKTLKEFPLPSEPVVVGVYNFKDQTGQYKAVENGSTFSTAVSQGATTMLIKSLEDSKWFTPIERENLGNLLNERNIIRSTRDEYRKNSNPNEPNLPPLLYAGILLEGGIVSYDSNIITGGLGARYFGVGGSTKYRQDRMTIYLRAVSTSSGRILKTVYISKTILSQAVDASLFRYVNFQRLLEVETGYTKNEPVQLAMKDAIEKAVEALIIEGIDDKIWTTKEGEETNLKLVEDYKAIKKEEEATLLYNRKQIQRNYPNSFSASISTPLLNADYGKKALGYGVSLGYSYKISNRLNLNLESAFLTMKTGNNFSNNYMDFKINAETLILPSDEISPFLYAGGGYLLNLGSDNLIDSTPKLQFGLGVNMQASDKLAVRVFAENNITFSDKVDGIVNGKRDDFYYNFGVGINYFFGSNKEKRTK